MVTDVVRLPARLCTRLGMAPELTITGPDTSAGSSWRCSCGRWWTAGIAGRWQALPRWRTLLRRPAA